MRRKLTVPFLIVAALAVTARVEAAQTRVLFISNPPGATVTDATLGEIGRTPFRMNLKRKTALECTFAKPGYESRTVTQTVDGLKLDVRADLPALPLTTVRLGVEPRNASVRLSAPDGTEVYTGEGGRVHTLPNGFWATEPVAEFHLEAWAPGYRPLEREIELTQHEYHDLSLPLNEISTVLSITSELESVRIQNQYLGDLGSTPLERRVSMVELMRSRSRRGAIAGDPAHLVLTLSKTGFATRAVPIALDFERAENPVSVTLESNESPSGN